MEEQMRKIGRQMAIRMGILMSFCLSLVGILSSGHFTVPGFIISFILSTIISLIIGFIIPIGKVTAILCARMRLQRGAFGTRVFESLVSNTIYTPVMTLVMVAFAYNMAMRQSEGMAQIPFVPMFLKSLFICYVVGFFLIFIFQPLLLKQLMKKNGPERPE